MTETSVREWVIHSYSGYKGLVLQDCEMEEAGPGEVRLRIEAFALNWGDADLMLDNYSFSFPKFPARIGMEACGIIDQIGQGVTLSLIHISSPRDKRQSRMPSSA